jgi:hypothetical protein
MHDTTLRYCLADGESGYLGHQRSYALKGNTKFPCRLTLHPLETHIEGNLKLDQ